MLMIVHHWYGPVVIMIHSQLWLCTHLHVPVVCVCERGRANCRVTMTYIHTYKWFITRTMSNKMIESEARMIESEARNLRWSLVGACLWQYSAKPSCQIPVCRLASWPLKHFYSHRLVTVIKIDNFTSQTIWVHNFPLVSSTCDQPLNAFSSVSWLTVPIQLCIRWCESALMGRERLAWASHLLDGWVQSIPFYLPQWLWWLTQSAHWIRMAYCRSQVQFVDQPVDFVFEFQGACFEINFSGRQKGFGSVLYNLWPLANIELSDK